MADMKGRGRFIDVRLFRPLVSAFDWDTPVVVSLFVTPCSEGTKRKGAGLMILYCLALLYLRLIDVVAVFTL